MPSAPLCRSFVDIFVGKRRAKRSVDNTTTTPKISFSTHDTINTSEAEGYDT